jgi:hypothetical protein
MCKNSQLTWSVSEIVIENPGDREDVSCTFKASGKLTIVQLVHAPSSTMTTTFERSYSTAFVDGGGSANEENSGTGTAILMFIGALVLIGFLVGAILLTRDREEEVERDIFNYCPACDGNLKAMRIVAHIVRSTSAKPVLSSTNVLHVASLYRI